MCEKLLKLGQNGLYGQELARCGERISTITIAAITAFRISAMRRAAHVVYSSKIRTSNWIILKCHFCVIRPSVWSLNHSLKHWFGWGNPDTEVHADWGAIGLDGHEYVQHDEEEGSDDKEYEGNHDHCVPCTSLIFQEENCLTRTMTGTSQFEKGIGLWLRLNAKSTDLHPTAMKSKWLW